MVLLLTCLCHLQVKSKREKTYRTWLSSEAGLPGEHCVLNEGHLCHCCFLLLWSSSGKSTSASIRFTVCTRLCLQVADHLSTG